MRIIIQDEQELPLQSDIRFGQKLPKMKKQIISGLVTRIVDGNTFEMSIHAEDDHKRNDKYTETIRIHGMDKPLVSTLSGILAKLELEKKIVGHKVECEIIERNESNQIIAVLPKRYLLSSFPFDPSINY